MVYSSTVWEELLATTATVLIETHHVAELGQVVAEVGLVECWDLGSGRQVDLGLLRSFDWRIFLLLLSHMIDYKLCFSLVLGMVLSFHGVHLFVCGGD